MNSYWHLFSSRCKCIFFFLKTYWLAFQLSLVSKLYANMSTVKYLAWTSLVIFQNKVTFLWYVSSRAFDHLQNCSLWVEWFCGIDLVENCSCIHQDLPDVVVISSARANKDDNFIKPFFLRVNDTSVETGTRPPFGESSSHIKFSRHRVNKRVEDWDVKYQFLKSSTRRNSWMFSYFFPFSIISHECYDYNTKLSIHYHSLSHTLK